MSENIQLKNIRNCARCYGDHVDVEAREMCRPFAPAEAGGVAWTHWFPCPYNGEPVLVRQEAPTELTPIERDEPECEPNWGKPSLAVIASDGKGNGCVMHYVGAHLDQWRNDVGGSLKDLTLDDAPAGISIWEGKVRVTRSWEGEYDGELEGEFREPTPEEWDHINADECPWDVAEWFLPAPEKA